MKHMRDSVNPEVREFIKQFNSSQQELRVNKQTSTDQSTSTIVQSDIKSDHVKVKEVFFKLPPQESTENKQPYLKISKTPAASSFTNSLLSYCSESRGRIRKKELLQEKPLLSIQQNTIQMSISPKQEQEYLDDDSFIRQIQQTLLSPNQTPQKVQIRAFECFDSRQKKVQVQKDQKLQKQRETQELTKLVDEFKSFLLRTRASGRF